MRVPLFVIIALVNVITIALLGKATEPPRHTASTLSRTPSAAPAKCSFSDREIDLNTQQLPVGDLGNDPGFVTESIIKEGTWIKDEFETTAQFEARRESLRRKPIVGNLTYGSYFAFSDTGEGAFRYDADKGLFNVKLDVKMNSDLRTTCEPRNGNKINILLSDSGRRRPDIASFEQHFDQELEKARLLKPNLRVLYVGTLVSIQGELFSGATLLHDRAASVIHYRRGEDDPEPGLPNLLLKEVWIYDIVTGTVLLKKSPIVPWVIGDPIPAATAKPLATPPPKGRRPTS